MRRTRLLLLQLLLSLTFGLAASQSAKAQFGGPVTVVGDTSPTSLKQLINLTKQTIAQLELVHTQHTSLLEQLAEYTKEGSRWLETVEHYAAVVESNIKRFTTLKGILGFTEQQLGMNEDTLKALAAIGETVSGVFTIKNQLESLITTRLKMLKSIEDRAKQGIFNPSADMDDLEEYLRTSIGRDAQQVIATRARLAQFDNQLERWTHDLEIYQERKASILKLKNETHDLLKQEIARRTHARDVAQDANGAAVNSNPSGGRVSGSSDAIDALNKQLFDCEAELNRLDALISDLLNKIEERYKQYHMKFDESKHTATEYEKANEAWDDFLSIKDEAALDMLEGFHGDDKPQLTPRRRRP